MDWPSGLSPVVGGDPDIPPLLSHRDATTDANLKGTHNPCRDRHHGDLKTIGHQQTLKESSKNVILANLELLERMSEVEDGLRRDMASQLKSVQDLEEKVDDSRVKIKTRLSLYSKQQHALREINEAVESTRAQFQGEVQELSELTKRLQKLQSRRSFLQSKVKQVSSECDKLASDLQHLSNDRRRMEALRARFDEINSDDSVKVLPTDSSSQTVLDADVFQQVVSMQHQLNHQAKVLKDIRRSVDLVKRCT